jgi:predicted DNA-binding protein
MTENYTRLLVTKLNQSTHERLKEMAKQDRRTLSAMSRIIIEDHIAEIQNTRNKNLN